MRLNQSIASPDRLSRLALTFAFSMFVSACSNLPSLNSLPSVAGDKVLGLVTPYRMEIVQGNVLTKELVSRVKPGMTRVQVRDMLGSPLLTDIFHDNRWDYVFTIRRQGAAPQRRHVVAWFEAEKLKSLDVPADLPTENEFVMAINTRQDSGVLPKLELSEAERKALPVPVKRALPTPESLGPQRSYPPLEPRQ